MTSATIRRIITLANTMLRTRHTVFQDNQGRWQFGWGTPGCILDWASCDDADPSDGFATEREAWVALCETCLDTMRDYAREAACPRSQCSI
jgi:hypothetical protein